MSAISDAQRFHFRLGEYYEHREQFSKARKWYSRAAKNESPETEFKLGNLEYRVGNFAKAAEHLSKSVAGGIGRFEAIRRLALSLEKLGNRYEAEELLHSEFEKNPTNVQLEELLGAVRSRNGQFELRQLRLEKGGSTPREQSASGSRNSEPAVTKSAPAWLRAEFLSARLGDRRGDADWMYNYATVLEEAGKLSDAVSIYEEACSLEPSRSWWWYRCGRAYELIGDLRRARERYASATEHDTKLDSRKWGIGAFHHEGSKWDLSGQAFEDDAVDASEVWRRAGLFYRAGHNYLLALNLEDAERCLKRAISLRPADVKWRRLLADTLELRGKHLEAAATLELLLTSAELSEADARSTMWAAGRVFRLAGDLKSSVFLLQSALQIESNDSDLGQDVTCSKRGSLVSAIDSETLAASLPFHGSTDRRGHAERANIAKCLQADDLQMDSLRKAELLSGTNEILLAAEYSRRLVDSGNLERAAEVLLRTRVFWGPYPDGFHQPKKDSHTYRLAAYKEWHENLLLEDDVILYESNLGLSVDCNPLALCRHLLAGDRRYIHIWAVDGQVAVPEDLLESNDVLVVQKDSLQYTRLLASAKYLVNNSTFPTYFTRRDDQLYLMTWHGTPLKTLAKDMPDPLVHMNMARNYLQATHAIFPNEHTRRVLVDRMDLRGLLSAKVQITGYPRNDALAVQNTTDNTLSQETKVLFAPTWREDAELENQVETLIQVRNEIVAAGYTPLVRAHHYVESAALAVNPNIEFIPRRVPTNDVLIETDILITDFSSVYFDYAITGRPIIFYTPDWDEYSIKRGMYFDKEQLPGPVCDSIDQLRTSLERPVVDSAARRKFLDEYAPNDDGGAAERVSQAFFNSGNSDFAPCSTEISSSLDQNRGVLIRQSFIPNGMASSFVNLVTTLAARGVEITVLTDGRSVQNDPARQRTMARLPEGARVIGRVGMQVRSMIEYHASVASSNIANHSSCSLEGLLASMFEFEARRVLPVKGFSAAIEFDGYSEFMARLVSAIGDGSESKSIYLHNDILDEIRLRMPELTGVVQVLSYFDHVVAVSEGSSLVNAEKLSEAYGIDTSKFAFARNVILPKQIKEDARHSLSAEVQEFIDGAELTLVQVGRISPEKNHDFSVDVVSQLLDRGVDCRLLIVGDGPLAPRLASKIQKMGLEGQIRLIGWVDNPYPYIKRADAMLLPSHHEGQPMVILEAQTLGTPVVGSQISSLEAMGVTGPQFLLPLVLEEWVDCLAEVASNGSQTQVVFNGEAYVNEVIEEFSIATGVCVPSSESSISRVVSFRT